MAETLTFEDTTETTTIDNLSAEEQDSLQVGEAMQEAEDTRLAGKYENAQELEKAYIELEKILGQQSNESKEEAVEETTSSNPLVLYAAAPGAGPVRVRMGYKQHYNIYTIYIVYIYNIYSIYIVYI